MPTKSIGQRANNSSEAANADTYENAVDHGTPAASHRITDKQSED
jgi:hypothetical protein